MEYTRQQVLDANAKQTKPVPTPVAESKDEYSYSEVTGKKHNNGEKTALDKGIRAVGQIPLELAGLANMALGLIEAGLNPAFTIGESVIEYINTNDEEYVKKVKQEVVDARASLEGKKEYSISEIKKLNELEGELNGRTFKNIAKEIGQKYDEEAYFHPGTYIGDEAKAAWNYMKDKLGHEYSWDEFQRELHEETATGAFAEGLTNIINNVAKKGEALGVPKEITGAVMELGMFYALPKGFQIAGAAAKATGLYGTAKRLVFLSDKHKMDRQIKTLEKQGDIKAAQALRKVDELNVYNPITKTNKGTRPTDWKIEAKEVESIFKTVAEEGKNLKSAKSQEVWHDAFLQLAKNQNSQMQLYAMKAHQASQAKLIKAYGKDNIAPALERISEAIGNPKLVRHLPKVERQIYREDFLPLRRINTQITLTLQKQTMEKGLTGRTKRAEMGVFDNEFINVSEPHYAKLKERQQQGAWEIIKSSLIGSRQLRTEVAYGPNSRLPPGQEVKASADLNLRSAQKNQVYQIIQRAVPSRLAEMLDNFNKNKVITRESKVPLKAFEKDKPSILYPQGRINYSKPIIDKKTGVQKNVKEQVVDTKTGEITYKNIMADRVAYKEIQRFSAMLEFIGLFDNSKGSSYNFQKAANAHYDITVKGLTQAKLNLRKDMLDLANKTLDKKYAGKKTGKEFQREVDILTKEKEAIARKQDQLDYWYKGKRDSETNTWGGTTGKEFFNATIEQANKIANGKLVKSDYMGPGRVRNMTENIIAVTKYKDKRAGSINQMRIDDAGTIQFLRNQNLTSAMNRAKKSIPGSVFTTVPKRTGRFVKNSEGVTVFKRVNGLIKSLDKKTGKTIFKDKKGKIVKDIVEQSGVKTAARIISASPKRLNKELNLGKKETGPKYLEDPILVEGLKFVENSQKLRDATMVDNIALSPFSQSKIVLDPKSQKIQKEPVRDTKGRLDKRFLDEEGNPVPQPVERVSPSVDFQRMGIEELSGIRMSKRTAEIFEDIFTYHPPTAFTNISNAIVRNMLINPFPHIHNEFVHLVGTSGLSLNPFTAAKDLTAMYGKNGHLAKATQDVLNQSNIYLIAKKEGGPMMSTNVVIEGWMDQALKSTMNSIIDKKTLGGMAKTLGVKPIQLYGDIAQTFSRKGMWQIRDIFYVALIRQKLQKYNWKETPENIKKAARIVDMHMPTYRLPPRIGEKVLGEVKSRQLAKILGNPNYVIFARYKHGMVSSGLNTLRDMMRVLDAPLAKAGKPGMTVREFIDSEGVAYGRSVQQQIYDGWTSFLGLTVGMQTVYALIDSIFAEVVGTGYEAKIRRGGVLHLVHTASSVASGDKTPYSLFGNLVTINPVFMTGAEVILNTTFYNGQEIYDLKEPGYVTMQKILGRVAKSAPMYSQYSLVTQEGDLNKRQLLLRQIDITEKSPSKLRREKRREKMQEGKRRRDRNVRLRESRL